MEVHVRLARLFEIRDRALAVEVEANDIDVEAVIALGHGQRDTAAVRSVLQNMVRSA